MTYEAHFINDGDRVFGTERFEAEHDAHAIAHAKVVFASNIGKGYRIFQDGRFVHEERFRRHRG